MNTTCLLVFAIILATTTLIQAYPQPQDQEKKLSPEDIQKLRTELRKSVNITDPAWKDILDGSIKFQIFRIENFQVIPVQKETFGKFYEGDAYIVFNSSKNENETIQHIHFWIGEDASQDEYTVAAYKTVELDDLLGGGPIQHREVQGYESGIFKSYFKNGIQILDGGVPSGLNHVIINENIPKLFIVKGKIQPIIRQVDPIAWNQFNDGDAFVLNAVEYVFVWFGKKANKFEKFQAAMLGQSIKGENGGGSVVTMTSGQENEISTQEKVVFDRFLPLNQKEIEPASNENESDVKLDITTRRDIKLYRVTDENGKLEINEVKSGPLYQQDLLSKDSFIIDNGVFGIWAWIGKDASFKEKFETINKARNFIETKSYPENTQVTRIIDGDEPVAFKSLIQT